MPWIVAGTVTVETIRRILTQRGITSLEGGLRIFLDVGASGNEARNFFVFDRPQEVGRIDAAALSLFQPSNGWANDVGDPETYQVYEVTTPVDILTTRGKRQPEVFQDLGDGPVYGERVISRTDGNSNIIVPLNQTAIQAITSGEGPIAIGGALTTLNENRNDSEATFGFTQRPAGRKLSETQLILTQFDTTPLPGAGSTYSRPSMKAPGTDGKATDLVLPAGWQFTGYGGVYANVTNRSFPILSSLGRVPPLLNAGAENDPDRALALAVIDAASQPSLQFVAEINGAGANGLQLGFDVEAWDASSRQATDSIGEAAFDVLVDIDRGNGFEPLLDLGTTSTGPVLQKPTGDRLDGNAEPNRVSFDSGPLDADVPTGSRLRVRWTVAETVTKNWVFGLDNVSLSLLSGGHNTVGDFNGDGSLGIDDLNTLTPAIQANSVDTRYDLDGSGVIDLVDRQHWVTDIKNTWIGDTNLDGVFDTSDMITAFSSGQYEDAVVGNSTWSTGDWNGDGEFDSSDLIEAFGQGGYEAGPRAALTRYLSLRLRACSLSDSRDWRFVAVDLVTAVSSTRRNAYLIVDNRHLTTLFQDSAERLVRTCHRRLE